MVVLNAVINRADARYLETMSFFLQFHDAPMKLQRSGLVPAEMARRSQPRKGQRWTNLIPSIDEMESAPSLRLRSQHRQKARLLKRKHPSVNNSQAWRLHGPVLRKLMGGHEHRCKKAGDQGCICQVMEGARSHIDP
jgi:hypothetical protein